MMTEACGHSLTELQASNCQLAITDETFAGVPEVPGIPKRDSYIKEGQPPIEESDGKAGVRASVGVSSLPNLEFLDVSFNKEVTDVGLNAFEGKTVPLKHLSFTGCTGISGKGLSHPISACKDTLEIFEGALMDQEDMKIPDFGKSLGECFKIQCIDLAGCRAIGDDFFNHLMNGEQVLDGIKTKPGLPELNTLKVNFLIRIMDGSI